MGRGGSVKKRKRLGWEGWAGFRRLGSGEAPGLRPPFDEMARLRTQRRDVEAAAAEVVLAVTGDAEPRGRQKSPLPASPSSAQAEKRRGWSCKVSLRFSAHGATVRVRRPGAAPRQSSSPEATRGPLAAPISAGLWFPAEKIRGRAGRVPHGSTPYMPPSLSESLGARKEPRATVRHLLIFTRTLILPVYISEPPSPSVARSLLHGTLLHALGQPFQGRQFRVCHDLLSRLAHADQPLHSSLCRL